MSRSTLLCAKRFFKLSGAQPLRFNLISKFCTKPASNNNSSDTLSQEGLSEEPSVSKLLEDAASFNEAKDEDWATSPYTTPSLEEDDKVVKPKCPPSDGCVILFPGQGTIKVGAVKEYLKFPRVRELFHIANDELGYDLLKLCLSGPQVTLNQTEINQPATVIMSLAALEKLREERPRVFDSCVAVAGYSIGELTALIFSGAISVESGIRVVNVRAIAMKKASTASPQGMISAYCGPTFPGPRICEDARKWAMDVGVENPECRYNIP